jgi:hypothetical protein
MHSMGSTYGAGQICMAHDFPVDDAGLRPLRLYRKDAKELLGM